MDRARQITGRDVHVAGYSQGGMFAYQAAAYRRSRGIKSLVTFGSPVDIHRNVPAVASSTVGAMVRAVEPAVMAVLDRIEGLPGELTSNGFKLLSTRKEIQQRIEFVRRLHDRGALVRREARRRFLGGGGFVAWPGPALRTFVDQFIVHNRMLSGGFVIDGRTVTLADITCPVFCMIGLTDDMARPGAVRAITRAAPEAKVDFLELAAGHFGMVVGSRATEITWPTVAAWLAWQEGLGPRPKILDEKREERPDLEDFVEDLIEDEPEGAGFDVDVDLRLFVDSIAEAAKSGWRRMGDITASAGDAYDSVRYREPRLRRLAQIDDGSRISPGLALAEQAERTPEGTFFLWQGRAFSYAEADTRVSHVVKGLVHLDIRPGDRVGVVMGSRPSFLSMVTALSRLGAIPVLFPPETSPTVLGDAIRRANVRACAADPEFVSLVTEALREPSGRLEKKVLVLGGGAPGKSKEARAFPPGVVDMETIATDRVLLPPSFQPNPGKGSDVALVLHRPNDAGLLRAVEVTNHRWGLSALGAAAACTLKPEDTVYCAIPLHHPAGILVSVGAALAGGARLALSGAFSAPHIADAFYTEARRYGATVVFYAGEMTRALLERPASAVDKSLAVRLFAGSGMRQDLWRRMADRFGAGIMEFYASTSQNVILANASGRKVGALGQPMPGCAELAVVRCDRATGKPVRDELGFAMRASTNEPGLLVARCAIGAPPSPGVTRGLFAEGDSWYVSNDIVTRDPDGDYWFVDALSGFVRVGDRPVSTRKVEDALYALEDVRLASAYGVDGEGGKILVASIVVRGVVDGERLAGALATLEPEERPAYILQVETIPLTDGFRPRKRLLDAAGIDAERAIRRWTRTDAGYAIG
ncbi:MAG: alpha/beta fold hydrolase [Polyangiaceae bacterium]